MKILIVSPHFPTPDAFIELSEDPRSKFLLRYALSWANLGHSVTVLHTPPRYPLLFNLIAKLCNKLNLFPQLNLARFLKSKKTVSQAIYKYSNITIYRFPMVKLKPNSDYFRYQISQLSSCLSHSFFDRDFDMVFCDYLSPSADLIEVLFPTLSRSNIFPIIHQTDVSYFNKNRKKYTEFLSKASTVLFRSKSLKEFFNQNIKGIQSSELMLSGIPDDTELGCARVQVRKFLYAGTLRESKNVHRLIAAFSKLRKSGHDVVLDIVGDGEYRPRLEMLVESLSVKEAVHFRGRLNHDAVFRAMKEADVFVMVSRETFGMVYVEAMSQGCITIAAQGQGIDGVINNGANGFLVPLESDDILEDLFRALVNSPPEKISLVSSAAVDMAREMTDTNLARALLVSLGKQE